MRLHARRAGRQSTLGESDYLLMVDDRARQGALRFQDTQGGPFLAHGGQPIPPFVRLSELLRASDMLQADEADAETLRLLLAPGSSLGGARPKATVLDCDGTLAIAKFPSVHDDWPVIRWEHVTLSLARRAGLLVPDARLAPVSGRAVLLVGRFDRAGAVRLPFLSALAMIGARDGEGGHSYLELVDAIRQHGVRIDNNLRELWARMVFNVLVSNTDDHLRNHGFLRETAGWVLSPAYDLNPAPIDVKPRVHALALDDENPVASLETALSVCTYFGLNEGEARAIARRSADAASTWRTVAREAGLRAVEIERMESAFEHDDLAAALTLR